MEMGISSYGSIAVSIILVAVVTCAWRILNWVWFRPKKLESYLRKQGLEGNSYRFLYGDLKENVAVSKKAKSSPIDFSDNVALRVIPFLLQLVNNYGNCIFSSFP